MGNRTYLDGTGNSIFSEKNPPIPPFRRGGWGGNLRKRNPELVISLESVLQKLKERQEIVLVDVRNSMEFEKFRIPGSINIPLFAIKTKTILKSKPLVLINEGYYYSPLEQECKRLIDSGFTSVSIFNGGLNYWKGKGYPFQGNIFVQDELNKIPPQIFFIEKDYEDWIAFDVSESKIPESHAFIPQGIHIPYSDDPETFISKLKAAINKYKRNSLLSVLIFNEDGGQYEKIEKLIQKTETRNIFYLKGGLKGYKGFLQQQELIWQPKDNIKKTKTCGGCP